MNYLSISIWQYYNHVSSVLANSRLKFNVSLARESPQLGFSLVDILQLMNEPVLGLVELVIGLCNRN